LGELTRAHGWQHTPLGDPHTWPESLKTTLRLLLTSNHPMFIWWGPDLIQFYNDAYRQTMGPERHPSALGQPGRECWAEIWDIIGPQIDYVMAGQGATWHVDQLVPVTRHGKRDDVWWTYGYSPIADESGVRGVLVVCNDVTAEHNAREALSELNTQLAEQIHEREEAQTALKVLIGTLEERVSTRTQEEQQLRSMFEQAPAFISFLKGPYHVFDMVNSAYYQLVGHRNLIGRPIRQALPEVEGQGFFELLDQVYASGLAFVGRDMPVSLQKVPVGDPETAYVDLVYQPIFSEAGDVIGIFALGNDVTAQKTAQDQVSIYQQQLEKMVADGATALEETRSALRQATKLEAIGKLTGGVAHDFNNILQVISGNLQLLASNVKGDAEAQKRLATAGQAVARGAKLSSQLLSFARRQPLQPIVLNLGRTLGKMDDMLRRSLGEAVEIEMAVGGGLWHTLADPNQLENVILNVAINARDAMNGEGKLTIELANTFLDQQYTARYEDVVPGEYVMIAVSDTGAGMSPEVQEHAFDPFFTTKPEGEGTGLGLSMAYGFAKQSAGHINIYSELNHGTTIRLYLPRAHAEETRLPAPLSGPVRGGSETILVVEDDVSVQTTVVDMLRQLGYQVLKANDAQSALTIIKSGIAIDLLFTDVVMPGPMRSTELARLAKLHSPRLEILFTSGYAQNAIVHGGRLDPGVDLISKPYRREDLARRIRHIIANRDQADLLEAATLSVEEEPQHTQDFHPHGIAGAGGADIAHSILLVEDNEDLRTTACELLSLLGYEVESAASAEDALELLALQKFDILLTDIKLPGLSGPQLAEMVTEQQPAIRIIFASGYGDKPQLAAGINCSMLAKPYDLEQLKKVLQG
ncbi:response regulator, partial [Undibacterium sp.]|uniref:hybrid sensor histidine kinase/response regulator n=1 Tax=Undibacterium sp. TaxID=1914977 RepID=UPI00374D2BBA